MVRSEDDGLEPPPHCFGSKNRDDFLNKADCHSHRGILSSGNCLLGECAQSSFARSSAGSHLPGRHCRTVHQRTTRSRRHLVILPQISGAVQQISRRRYTLQGIWRKFNSRAVQRFGRLLQPGLDFWCSCIVQVFGRDAAQRNLAVDDERAKCRSWRVHVNGDQERLHGQLDRVSGMTGLELEMRVIYNTLSDSAINGRHWIKVRRILSDFVATYRRRNANKVRSWLISFRKKSIIKLGFLFPSSFPFFFLLFALVITCCEKETTSCTYTRNPPAASLAETSLSSSSSCCAQAPTSTMSQQQGQICFHSSLPFHHWERSTTYLTSHCQRHWKTTCRQHASVLISDGCKCTHRMSLHTY